MASKVRVRFDGFSRQSCGPRRDLADCDYDCHWYWYWVLSVEYWALSIGIEIGIENLKEIIANAVADA